MIDNNFNFTESIIMDILKSLVDINQHLHNLNLYHQDLNTDNVFI
jgi:hypothetical protein